MNNGLRQGWFQVMGGLCLLAVTSTVPLSAMAQEPAKAPESDLLRSSVQFDVLGRLYDSLDPDWTEGSSAPVSTALGLGIHGGFPQFEWLEWRGSLSTLLGADAYGGTWIVGLTGGVRVHNPHLFRVYLEAGLGFEAGTYGEMDAEDTTQRAGFAHFLLLTQAGFAVDVHPDWALDLGASIAFNNASAANEDGVLEWIYFGVNLGVAYRY